MSVTCVGLSQDGHHIVFCLFYSFTTGFAYPAGPKLGLFYDPAFKWLEHIAVSAVFAVVVHTLSPEGHLIQQVWLVAAVSQFVADMTQDLG